VGSPGSLTTLNKEFAMASSRLIVGVVSAVALSIGLAAQGANAGEAKETAPIKNIVQIAREAGSFKTLVAAIEATDVMARNGIIHVIDSVLIPGK
jgi:uncharacterized surface protein with fasciclin (FAS1) repeats